MYNPDLNLTQLTEQFAVEGRLRITDILAADYAEVIAERLESRTQYAAMLNVKGQNKALMPSELAEMPLEERKIMQETLKSEAARGIGFHYNGHQIGGSPHPELTAFLDFVNSEQALSVIRKITGQSGLKSADGQATQYLPGHYLTRHSDNIPGQERQFAYVFGLTRSWHPDWGGLLQFFEKDGTPKDAWLPGFNTLSIFDVRHIHSVTYVAPYALAPRHSITGWFRLT